MSKKFFDIDKATLLELKEKRQESREWHFDALVPVMGEEAVAEVRKIYELFDERMLLWYAGLWDSDSGAFYFSEDARDTDGFYPDIESTAQAVQFIATQCGIGTEDEAIAAFPRGIADRIADYATSLQDEDGFFYHPQWGKNISPTRRGRDLGWARRMITPLGRKCKYLRPTERKGEEAAKQLPDYLQSTDAFRKWCAEHDLSTKSYSIGNFIDSTSSLIKAAGKEYVEILINWLNENQNPENGLWEKQVNYQSVNGLMKIGRNYPGFGYAIPNVERAYESARYAVLSDEQISFSCEFYNAWAALNATIASMKFSGDNELVEKYRLQLRRDAPSLIRRTREKMLCTYCGDGTFAYFAKDAGKVCSTSQGAPVSTGRYWQADVNGNGCSTRGPLRHMFDAFGVDMPPLFCKADAEFFFGLLD